MDKIISEDAARRALLQIEEGAGIQWLEAELARCTMPVLSAVSGSSWILDTDTTVSVCMANKKEQLLDTIRRSLEGPHTVTTVISWQTHAWR